jgi:hypothetical protein
MAISLQDHWAKDVPSATGDTAVYRRLREIPKQFGRRDHRGEETMQIYSMLTLVGLLISVTSCTTGNQKAASDNTEFILRTVR